MIKATKATKRRLQKEDFTPRVRVATMLERIIQDTERAERETGTKAFYTENGIYYSCYPSEVPLFRGLESKYPSLIHTTLTYGLNEIIIPDINKLVKAMLLNH